MSKLGWLICSLILATSALAQEPGGKLKMAIIVTRHGVRPPLSPDPNSDYAKDAWPAPEDWGVKCPGDLTPTGFKLATFMGAYYSDYFIRNGMLPNRCPSQQTYVWADNEERTMGTSKAIAQGLAQKFPGCSLKVNFYNKRKVPTPPDSCTSPYQTDCIFHPLADWCHNSPVDPQSMQDVADGINLSLRRLNRFYRTELTELQNVLICCKATVCSKDKNPPLAACTLLNVPDQATIDGGKLKWQSRFSQSSTAAENLLLEYANNMPCQLTGTGWGRVAYDYTKDCNPAGGQPFQRMQRLHGLYFERTQRARYIARTQGSNLANQILQQLENGKAGNATAPLVIYGAHDTNLANLSGMLGISWSLSDLPRNDTPPAGALVFELYENKGDYFVAIRYVHATMKQMREQTDFARKDSPESSPIAIPKCPAPCKFSTFQNIMKNAIDTKFVVPNPPED